MCDLCAAGCADLHLLDMLSPMERKRQGYIHELIVTEENYVNDLQLVTEVSAHTHTHTQSKVAWRRKKCHQRLLLCADLPQAAAGLRAADGEGGGHDLRQLEGAHYVQHQAAQVKQTSFSANRFFFTEVEPDPCKNVPLCRPLQGSESTEEDVR